MPKHLTESATVETMANDEANGRVQNGVEELSEIHGNVLDDLDQSMWDLFHNTALKTPQNIAVVSIWQPKNHLNNLLGKTHPHEEEGNLVPNSREDGVFEWTYEELADAVETLSGWLSNQACVEGENIVTFLWNSAEWILWFWAAARMKMVFVPLDPRTMEHSVDEFLETLKPAVLVVQDEAEASVIEKSSARYRDVKLRVSCTSSPSESWSSLSGLQSAQSHAPTYVRSPKPGDDLALIIFTSGTTSTRKGCCHTGRSLWSGCFNFDPDPDTSLIERWLIHTPVSHIFAINNTLRAFRYNGNVCFPSKSFDIHASLRALEAFQCTRMAAIPTLVQGLLSLPKFPGKDKLALRYVSLGGTLIKSEDVELCKKLGSDAVIQAYGMSEGCPTLCWKRADPLLASGHYSGVGKVLPGSRVRICPPDSRDVLPRNTPGELHVGGTSVISNYLHNVDQDAFYKDEYGTWLKTGDQASMDENGVIQILGRYKDLIIRGGENISPGKIEECLGQVPELLAQVVGLPDSIAGEVPVAVVQSLGSSTKDEIFRLVSPLGTSYSLAAAVTLQELGLEKYPLTPAGKVRKNVLRELVAKHFNVEVQTGTNGTKEMPNPEVTSTAAASPLNGDIQNENGSSVLIDTSSQDSPSEVEDSEILEMIQQLIDIWGTLLVNTPSRSDSVYDFADSISLLRYCDKVRRELGKTLFYQDFKEYDTIERQARFLHEAKDRNKTNGAADYGVRLSASEMTRKVNGAPGIADIFHTHGDPTRFVETKTATTKVLGKLGLSWETDVEDIIPIRDSFHVVADGPRPQSFKHRTAFRIDNKDTKSIRTSLEKALASRPLFRAVLVKLPDSIPVHVIVRPSKTLYDNLITETESDEEGIQNMILDDSGKSFSRTLMLQAVIVSTKDSPSTTLLLTFNHSVFDALSMIAWMRDLDIIITDPSSTLLPLTPYKLFADMAYSYRQSMPATLSVNYFVEKFTGISKHAKACWPPQRAPGWMIGTDRDCHNEEHVLARSKTRQGKPIQYPRLWTKIPVPGMSALKEKGIPPPIVVKTAIALFNVLQTGEDYAIFNGVDAGRSWPFMPSWIPLPSAGSIDGPTISWTGNMIHIPFHFNPKVREETVLELMQRIKEEEEEISAHAHAPWFRIMEGLGHEAALVQNALGRQGFNWDVTLQYLKQDVDLPLSFHSSSSNGQPTNAQPTKNLHTLNHSLNNSNSNTNKKSKESNKVHASLDLTSLTLLDRVDWPDSGFFWEAGLLGTDELVTLVTWDDAQVSIEEAGAYLDGLNGIIKWIIVEGNWGCGVREGLERMG